MIAVPSHHMNSRANNVAYIDGANLHKGIMDLGWKLDYRRFRIWLQEKYSVERAYLFLGLVPRHKDLYTFLQEAGYTLVFKETTYDGDGRVKGNCDADLVLRVARDVYEKSGDKAIIVTGDGDYACLVKFLVEFGRLEVVLAPNNTKCSILLKRLGVPLTFLNTLRGRLAYKEKAPDTDGTV